MWYVWRVTFITVYTREFVVIIDASFEMTYAAKLLIQQTDSLRTTPELYILRLHCKEALQSSMNDFNRLMINISILNLQAWFFPRHEKFNANVQQIYLQAEGIKLGEDGYTLIFQNNRQKYF